MLERIDALEQRVRDMQTKLTEVVDSLREMMEAKAKTLVGEAAEPPPDPRRK